MKDSWPRRLARRIIARFAGRGITPNQITSTRLAIGLAACALLSTGGASATLWAGGLWILAMFLDRVDGELARMTGMTSEFGHRLDYLSDLVLTSAFFVGLGYGLGGTAAWLGLVAGAAVLIIQMLAEVIDREQAPSGEKAFPQFAGFDPEDAPILFAPVAWFGWGEVFLVGASVGAPLFALFTVRRLAASRRRRAAANGGGGTAAVGKPDRRFRGRAGGSEWLRWGLLALVLAGFVGLLFKVADIDPMAVWSRLRNLGAGGMALLLVVYLVRTLADATAWLFALPALPVTPRWIGRASAVLVAGAVLEKVTPLAVFGGAPVKAVLLKRFHGVAYGASAASIVVRHTTDMFAMVLFIPIALYLGAGSKLADAVGRETVIAGMAALVLLAALFLALQRSRVISRTRRRWEAWPRGSSTGARTTRILDAIEGVERALVTFYSAHPGRFAGALAAAMCEITIGAFAVYLALHLMGQPATVTDAVVIEAIVLFINAMFFFVPAHVGTQEGAFVLASAALFGSPTIGIALAAIRRVRDLFWILLGLAAGAFYSSATRSFPDPTSPTYPTTTDEAS